MSDEIKVSIETGVMTVTLNRPAKKNALTEAMYGDLVAALDQAAKNDAVRVVLFAAEGDAFTAGNDIGDFARIASGEVAPGDMAALGFIRALAAAELPLVAAVQGLAVGLGLTMLLHCDLVYVSEDASLRAPFVSLALVPEAASSLLLPALIGHARAFAVFALDQPISGADAVSIGLANAALPRDEVLRAAQKAAAALAAKPAGALRQTKRLMRQAEILRAQIDAEAVAFGERLKSPEAKEAFTAFAEKRPPKFN